MGNKIYIFEFPDLLPKACPKCGTRMHACGCFTGTESKPVYDDKVVLFEAADGPEMLKIYTSEEQGVVDWSPSLPGLYIEISLNDVYSRFGPFTLATIREKLEEALKKDV